MLATVTRTRPKLNAALQQGIALLSLTSGGLHARVAIAASENPALRIHVPDGAHPCRPAMDPECLAGPGASLIGHVLLQIGSMRLAPRAQAIALLYAESLEPTGWLSTDVASVARICAVPVAEAGAVLAKLQQIEPAGLFARSLAECLRLQAGSLGHTGPDIDAVLARLPMLGVGDLAALASDAGRSPEGIERAVRVIRALDPKPGLVFCGPMPPLMPPDLVARLGAHGWTAARHPALPTLEIALGRGDHRAALAWQDAVKRRADLGARIATLLLCRQADYLGGAGRLHPITSSQLSRITQTHVATVNRIVKGVTMETPRGTFALRGLMARPLGTGGAAACTVRHRLAALLEEPASAALSDAKLATVLEAEGLKIARRTVAKYRAGLLRPASLAGTSRRSETGR